MTNSPNGALPERSRDAVSCPVLTRAITQMRQREPAAAQIACVIARASGLAASCSTTVHTPIIPSRSAATVSIVSCAAAILLLVTVLTQPRPAARVVPNIIPHLTQERVYSVVTHTSIAQACLEQIEADLREAEQRIAAARDAIEASQFHRDVGAALEKYRQW